LKQSILFFLLAGCLSGCGRPETAADPPTSVSSPRLEDGTITIPTTSPMLQQVQVETVKVGSVPGDEVTSPGKIEANPNRLSHIVLPVAGRVTNVLVKIGDSVVSGQPLLTVESPDADAATSAYLQNQASVTQAKANVTKAQTDYDRQKGLFEHDAVAMKDVQAAENLLVQAKTAEDQANAALEQTRRRLIGLGLKPDEAGHVVTVSAPIRGKVLELSIAPGEYRNDLSAPMMTIADLSTVWISADVPESYIRFISLGELIETNLVAYPGETFAGHVSRIADTVTAQTRTIKVQAEIVNPHYRLRPEMFGTIHHIGSTTMMPLVPSKAIIQSNDRRVVFLQEAPGRFRQVEITVGKPVGELSPVMSGLKANDKVVVDGGLLLQGLIRSIT
jgi:membrane fusion protein, heavy metal efflux system